MYGEKRESDESYSAFLASSTDMVSPMHSSRNLLSDNQMDKLQDNLMQDPTYDVMAMEDELDRKKERAKLKRS